LEAEVLDRLLRRYSMREYNLTKDELKSAINDQIDKSFSGSSSVSRFSVSITPGQDSLLFIVRKKKVAKPSGA